MKADAGDISVADGRLANGVSRTLCQDITDRTPAHLCDLARTNRPGLTACGDGNWLAAAGPSIPEADRTLGGDAGVFPARTVAWATNRGDESLRRLTQSGIRADGPPFIRVDYERSNLPSPGFAPVTPRGVGIQNRPAGCP